MLFVFGWVGGVGPGEGRGAAHAFGDVLAGQLEMDAAGVGPLRLVDGEERPNLGEDLVEVARLVAVRALDRVSVHGIAGPDHGASLGGDAAVPGTVPAMGGGGTPLVAALLGGPAARGVGQRGPATRAATKPTRCSSSPGESFSTASSDGVRMRLAQGR